MFVACVSVSIHSPFLLRICNSMFPENIHTPYTEGFWFETHFPTSLWEFQFWFILSFKNLSCGDTPLEYPIILLGLGMDIF